MTERLAPNSLLSQLDMQPRVRSFLARALDQGRTSHAYLFLGAPGSGKLDAAWALAQALICDDGGCGTCDHCAVSYTHLDVYKRQDPGRRRLRSVRVRPLWHAEGAVR